jgi:hypothetical protein
MKDYIWNKKNLPHKGWVNIGHEDLEVPSHTCQMCGKTEIRYVHTMYHFDVEDHIKVGCECAERMTDDYTTAKEQLRKMKKKTSWMTTNWKKEDYYEYEQKTFNSIYGRTNVEIFKCDKGYALCIDRRLYNSLTCPTKKEMKEMLYESFVSTRK